MTNQLIPWYKKALDNYSAAKENSLLSWNLKCHNCHCRNSPLNSILSYPIHIFTTCFSKISIEWNIVLLETLIVTHPVKKFPVFYTTWRFFTFTGACQSFLSWATWI